MRVARLREDGRGYYHCMSRVIQRQMLFDDREKERIRKLMRNVETFSGVHVLTFAILDNHFHLLLEVPEREEISDEEFLLRLGGIYTEDHVKIVSGIIKEYRDAGHDHLAEREKSKYSYRMYDVSEFMKTLKQKYTQSYNKRHARRGTLWEERFKSVMYEGTQNALLAVAAYIDLNAVRARIVEDPKDYRFCGYGEALAGKKAAKKGLSRIIATAGTNAGWGEVRGIYRKQLYIAGEAKGAGPDGGPTKPGFCFEKVEQVLADNGSLSRAELLRCKVRYFSDGVVIGSQDYVDEVFEKYHEHFGVKRKTGARKMRGGSSWGDLRAMRDLRVSPISLPT